MQSGRPRYNGPCPLCDGRDRFRVAQGASAVIVKCSHDCPFEDLCAALGLTDGAGTSGPAVQVRSEALVERNPWLTEVWERAIVADDTPGGRYLVHERAVWLANRFLPAAVRWLPASAAAHQRVRRKDWPARAAGCLVYRLATPWEAETWALKIEAIDATGHALPFGDGGKRPSLSGSNTDGGRRTFLAAGDPDSGIRLVEGPLDALALVSLGLLGVVDLGRAAVLGADGVGGFTPRACYGSAPVVLYPDGSRWDPNRRRWIPEAAVKAVQLMDALERAGRGRVRIVRQPRGRDIADEAQEFIRERRAIQSEE